MRIDQPKEVECDGHDLGDVLHELEAHGAMVARMDCVGLSHYRLTVAWGVSASPGNCDAPTVKPEAKVRAIYPTTTKEFSEIEVLRCASGATVN